MDLGAHAQRCASAYRDIGELNAWRKGRNSSRGYDTLTLPSNAWDDRPHDRYLLVLHGHLTSGAVQLGASSGCYEVGDDHAAVTLARAVFVESSKVSWLLEDAIPWTHRAARAHLELMGDLDSHVRRLPKKLESGYPNFHRKQWQVHRKQLRDEIVVELFGKRALSRDGDDTTLIGEALLTSAQLEQRFAQLLANDVVSGTTVWGPDLLLDAAATIAVRFDTPLTVDSAIVSRAMTLAIDAWIAALLAWVRYNGWDAVAVEKLAIN